jgi:thioredoxin reductase
LLLADVCPTVTLVHHGKKLHARREFVERCKLNHAITVFTESVVTRIIGDDHVQAVEIHRRRAQAISACCSRGVNSYRR